MWLYCLRSESEVSALGIGTCCFPRIVHEITVGPRPASRRHTGNVETDSDGTYDACICEDQKRCARKNIRVWALSGAILIKADIISYVDRRELF